MKLNPQQLTSHLQQSFLPLYWIAGDEPMLMQETSDRIRELAKQQGYENKIIFDISAKFDWNDFRYEVNAVSIFAEKTLIELRLQTNTLPESGRKILADYLENPAADKLILMTSAKIDTKSQTTKWFQAIEKKSIFIALWPLNPQELSHWLDAKLIDKQLNVSQEVKQLLKDYAQGNLLAIKNELEKLSLLFATRQITLDEAKTAIFDNSRYDIFDLADAALAGKINQLSKILITLRQEGVEPILILWALTKDLRLLLTLQAQNTTPNPNDFKKLGIFSKRIPLIQAALKRKQVNYAKLLQNCAVLDAVIKGAAAGNAWDQLQTLSFAIGGVEL